jgi:hypothetical protein
VLCLNQSQADKDFQPSLHLEYYPERFCLFTFSSVLCGTILLSSKFGVLCRIILTIHLLRGYNRFYERTLVLEITKTTWSRFFDSNEPVHAMVAQKEG